MTTAFSAITAAFVAALEAAPAVSTNVVRADIRKVEGEASDCVNVQFEGSEPNAGAISGAPIDWRSKVIVECYARSSTQSADVAVDPLLEAVFDRLASDATLGGSVEDIGVPVIEALYDAQGQKAGYVRLTYLVQHRTANNTIA